MKQAKNKSALILAILCLSTVLTVLPISNITLSNIDPVELDGIPDVIPDSSALEPYDAEWWDLSWAFRIQINYTANTGVNYTNKLVTPIFNFTDYLKNKAQTGTFDDLSVRVVEYNEAGSILNEISSCFEPIAGYDAQSNAIGNVLWILNGSTPENTVRHYFVYFDIESNGPKEATSYSTNLSLTENVEDSDYTLENNLISISMCEGLPPSTGTFEDHVYSVINKITGEEQCYTGYRWGWDLRSGSYGGETWGSGVTEMEVVWENEIALSVKMIWNATNFLYERYYTINNLDNIIEISHQVTAKADISAGNWQFEAYWYPSDSNAWDQCNSAYGLGGIDFDVDQNVTLGPEFSSEDDLYTPGYFDEWNPTTEAIRDEAWFVMWDEDDVEGVGTLWDNGSEYVSEYGYKEYELREGHNICLKVNPPALTEGETFEFNMYGVIFNDVDGTIVKNRSKGIQVSPNEKISESALDSGKEFNYQIIDIDGLPVEAATIYLRNETDETIIATEVTDANGNVTFPGLPEQDYQLWATYTVYDAEKATEFLISNESYTLDVPGNGLKDYHTFSSNLTTAIFYATDDDIDNPDYEMLFNVNVTIMDNETGDIITNGVTDENGLVSFRLPEDNYNLSVVYQGQSKEFRVNNTAIPFKALEHNFTINTMEIFNLNITSGFAKTTFEIVNTEYAESEDGWEHQELVSSAPYSMTFYKGDIVNVTLHYKDVKTDVSIVDADSSVWYLFDSNNQQVDTGSLSITDSSDPDGNYTMIIDSTKLAYTTGQYSLVANISEEFKQDGLIYIALNIQNRTTGITNLPSSTIVADWNSNVSIQVQYNTSSTTEIEGITGATVLYSLDQSPYSTGTLDEVGDGIYEFDFNTTLLDVGSYSFTITAYKDDFALSIGSVDIEVEALQSTLEWTIPSDYKITDLYMKVAWEENVSFSIDYSDINENGIDDASVFVYYNNTELYEPENTGVGVFSLEFNSTDQYIGLTTIRIVCVEDHHETQQAVFNIDIMDYWDTAVDIIEPPSMYPWGNNASFVMKYYCDELPRENLALESAKISGLNITVYDSGAYEETVYYDASDMGTMWGYYDLQDDIVNYGDGFYEVWFLTDDLGVSETSVFYVEPSINIRLYEPAFENPWVWIYPPLTTLSPYVAASPTYEDRVTDSFELYLDQGSWVNVTYNVTDYFSELNGNLLPGATVTYDIINVTGSTYEEIESDVAVDADSIQGWYITYLTADTIGDYRIVFTASLDNYSTAFASVNMKVKPKVFGVDLGDYSSTIITQPENQEFVFTIRLADTIFDDAPISDATLTFELNGQTYTLEATETPGEYSVAFTQEMLEALGAEQSQKIQITISKDNYDSKTIEVTLNVGLPVDPWVGFPIRYWIIVGATVLAMIGIYGVSKGIAYGRIPDIVKDIDSTTKLISKNKKISEEIIRPTRDEYIKSALEGYWERIGLSYENKKSKDNSSYSDLNGTSDTNSAIRNKKQGGNQ